MKILYKFATRERPNKFLQALDNIQKYAQHDDYRIAVTADIDDKSMHKVDVSKYENVKIIFSTSKNKVDAINRDMWFIDDWDILINMSDDMEFIKYGFDKIIISDFEKFRSLDLLLHYPDQKAGFAMITMAIMGKPYYDRFGYIYHPDYKSLWCDNEQMEVAQSLGRYKFIKNRLFNHNNPMHGLSPRDALHLKTLADHNDDKATFLRRKSENFK